MKLSDFDYNLPKELIAQEPISKRENSRLMVLKNNTIKHGHFYNLINYLNKDDVLVINETKVLKNMLVGRKVTGTKVWVVIEEKLKDDVDDNIYKCILRGKRLKVGNIINFKDSLKAKILTRKENICNLKFNKDFDLDQIAELPIPFYVKNHVDKQSRYQTVFAKQKGSFAAPTASLHFTKELLDKIRKKGVKIAKICLHISFGTFLPIKVEDFVQHKMHNEYYEVSEEAAKIINNCKGRLVCCGTTTVRTLEAAASDSGFVKVGSGKTDLFIYPGYKFKMPIKMMITNFHLPKSSLLLLVCGFYGRDRIFDAYNVAVKEKYRFYSFGDAMLLVKENSQPQ